MLLLISKPQGITSHDVVDRVRKITGVRRVGHAGTLDPFATGLLIVGVGREFTKQLGELTKNTTKTYVATLELGKETDSYDLTGIPLRQDFAGPEPELKKIVEVLANFEGEQQQTPPIFSAIKINGKKAYQFAREGEALKLNPRQVTIFYIKLINYNYPELSFECKVSSGTYIRSLAHDIGEKLKTGAFVKKLERTQIGDYSLNNALTLDKLQDFWNKQQSSNH